MTFANLSRPCRQQMDARRSLRTRPLTLLTAWAVLAVLLVGGASSTVCAADLLVSSFSTNRVVRYDARNGRALDIFAYGGGLIDAAGIAIGPDKHIYVASQGNHNVMRFDGSTGEFIDVFVPAGSGGLSFPTGLVFGPDGHLYVASLGTDQILKYDKASGAFLAAFVTARAGGLDAPIGLTFGPDGQLYVAGNFSHNVLRYDGTSGNFIDVFASGGGLDGPTGLTFGPDGHLYVSDVEGDNVRRYHGVTGALIGVFVTPGSGGLDQPAGLVFGPDGNLYVASSQTNSVLRYSASTGAFLNTFVSAGSAGLSLPTFLVFRTAPDIVFFSAGQDSKGSLAFGDFNGDGTADLAMGSFEQPVPIPEGGTVRAGAVTIVYSAGAGLRSAGSVTLHEARPGIPGVAQDGNEFARALAAGDFNGDGYDDLAIGVPGSDFGPTNSGAVVIVYGSPRVSSSDPGGLRVDAGKAANSWRKARLGYSASQNDRFGLTLAVGDFNNDGFDDLAVGAPAESSSSGSVYILPGGEEGVTGTGNQRWRQGIGSHGMLEGDREGDDRFGRALTTGDFNGDDFDDLAIGVPGEDTGRYLGADAGAVNVVYGSADGLSDEGNQIWTQDSDGVPEDDDRDDEFGAALAAGDFDGDGHDDLAIGIPSEDFGILGRKNKGRIVALHGSSFGLRAVPDQLWDRDQIYSGGPHENLRFGQVLAAADFNGDGISDLAIASFGENEWYQVGGEVFVLPGTSTGLSLAGVRSWNQDACCVPGDNERDDQFGSALAAGDAGRRVDGLRYGDLAVFVNDGPYGAANVFYGGPEVLFLEEGVQLFECGPDGVNGTSARIQTPRAFTVMTPSSF